MNDLMNLFHNLTPSTLAAIVTDLNGTTLWRETKAAMNAGVDNCGAEEFSEYLAEARAERGITIESDDSTPVGAILARQGR